jgi:hypothetical protein
LASALAASNCHAQESGGIEKYLTLEQAGNAEFVAMWLREKGAMANRKDAELFFEWGMQDKRRKYWSGAARAFGESMIRYPSPQV